MTEKLYEQDSYCRRFTAVVEESRPHGDGFAVRLSATAFFPEGGGQAADTGVLGGTAVTDVQIADGDIWHYTKDDLPVGKTVEGYIRWEQRFARMQHHTAEHIVCGLIHQKYGYENVGFHLGHEDVTLDLSGELTREQIDEIEDAANAVVASNAAVTAVIPPAEQLAKMTYRSKKEIDGPVRLVTIEGVDCCACCAPHVARTGEIGLIKLLDFIRYKGGVRIHLLCGQAALQDYRQRYTQTAAACAQMSVKQTDFTQAFNRLIEERDSLRTALKESSRRLADAMVEAVIPIGEPVCLFGTDWDSETLRRIVNSLTKRCGGICGAFSGTDGDYRYVVGGTGNLSEVGQQMREQLNAKGGGSAQQIQGRVEASAEEIRAFWRQIGAKATPHGCFA